MNTGRLDPADFERCRANARGTLLAQRTAAGHWVGELSSSALSTATAAAAFGLVLRASRKTGPEAQSRVAADARMMRSAQDWLSSNQNEDGGWGDTVDSPSNLSTTLLAWMASGLESGEEDGQEPRTPEPAAARAGAESWLTKALGGVEPERIASGLAEVYGEDKTFAVPILVACAAGGALGEGAAAWRSIAGLPYELAALPQSFFRWLGLPVVSYALPALIAIGQAVHHQRPSRNPCTRMLRNLTRARTLRKLTAIQPVSGGYLEAVPLTSFVVLSLVACGLPEHAVVERGLDFLRTSARPDGSWPIDSNLATWVSTLALNGLAGGGALDASIDAEERGRLIAWLLEQQFRGVHAYTGAAPGGWAWTDLPGGVPDADDTPGALLALAALSTCNGGERGTPALSRAARAGVQWLVDLQNRDGGIPTFCRGWGKLPFDRSCPDLTAHALRAWSAWEGEFDAQFAANVDRARKKAEAHLTRTQRNNGSWVPLWFGSQEEAHLENPLYGTSRVLRAAGCGKSAAWRTCMDRGLRWMLGIQHPDGGFGAARGVRASVEETAMALEALSDALRADLGDREELCRALRGAFEWLSRHTEEGTVFPARPIGLYFAKLWYAEKLYPLVYTVSALECSREWLGARAAATEEVQPRA